MTASRAAITLLLGITVMMDEVRDQMLWVVLILVGGLALVTRQSHQVNTLRLRNQSLVDLAVFLAVVPLGVITGFVAAGSDEMLPAERSVFLQMSVATVVALGLVALVSLRLFFRDRSDVPTMFLPAALIVTSLPFVLHDYRNQTVLAMIAVSYFLGTVAIPFSIIVDEAVRRYIGLVFAGATVLVGLLLFDPGLGNLGERAQLVQLVTWGIILLGLIVLGLLPHAATMFGSPGSSRGDSDTMIHAIRDRRGNDSSRSIEG